MAGVQDSLSWTQSDALAEVVAAESCHIVLATSPPDYVEKISRYLERQSRQGKVSDEPYEAESDSGDSLFITQKPVPEPVRSARRHRFSLQSDPTSPRDLEETDDDGSLSSSHGKSKTDKERRRKEFRLPKYSFPFLPERSSKPRSTQLSAHQNTSLHSVAMGGFFKCVAELWQSYRRGDDQESSLPTVDMDGDCISPLSEEEEEGRSEDEDIRVVERKCFVVPSKAKSRQTWCSQSKQQRGKKASNARQERGGRQWKTSHKLPAKASISRVRASCLDTDSSDDGELSCSALAERERDDEPHTLRRGLRLHTHRDRQASTTITEPQTDVFHTDDLPQTGQAEDEPESQNLHHSLADHISDTNDNRVCSETKKKKKGKGDHEIVEEEKGQSQEEPKGLDAATSVNVEVEETPSLSEDNSAEPPASQVSDVLEFNEKNWMEMENSHDDNALRQEQRDIPESKQKKKDTSAAENVSQEVDGNLESDSVFSVSCDVGTCGKQRKKKKKKRKRSVEDGEELQSSAVAEPVIDDAEVQKKKKKRKKERVVITQECEEEEASNRTSDLPPLSTGLLEKSESCLENTAASRETFESSYVKRKKHKKKQESSSNEATRDGEEGENVSFSDDAVTLAKSTGMSLKKKKKKKTNSDVSHTPEENEKVENVEDTQITTEGLEDQNAEVVTKKKKKKKKMGETSCRNISEDNVAQSDDSVSVRKKEKKRISSFLVADAEENDAQTHEEQNSPSQAAHVWGAEKPVVNARDFKTESAEIAGGFVESNDGLKKKKKKKRKWKMSEAQDGVEKDHKLDFEEPSRTCESALPETTDTGVKRKKKRLGNKSELVTPVERPEIAADVGHSLADEAVVMKKRKKCKDEPCHVLQESPPRKEGKQFTSPLVANCKHGNSVEVSHDGSTSDQATKKTLNMIAHASPSPEMPGNQALYEISYDMRDKKKKKKMKSTDNVLLEGKSLTESAELEPQQSETKEKKERNKQSTVPNVISSSPMLSETSLSKSDMSTSDRIKKEEHKNVKRRLHNPSEDFLTDY